MMWTPTIKTILYRTPQSLRMEEPKTGLTPFVFAASCARHNDTDTIGDNDDDDDASATQRLQLVFNLLRGAPDLIGQSPRHQ